MPLFRKTQLKCTCLSCHDDVTWSAPGLQVLMRTAGLLAFACANAAAGNGMEPHVARLPAYAEYPSWLDYARALQAPGDQPPSERLLPLVRNERGEVSTLPLFIVIGAQKCGTTFLRSALSQHPMLNAARGYRGRCGGEVHFFDYRAGPAASLAADPKDGTAIATELLTAYSTKHFQQPVSSCVPSRYLLGVSHPVLFLLRSTRHRAVIPDQRARTWSIFSIRHHGTWS